MYVCMYEKMYVCIKNACMYEKMYVCIVIFA